MIPSPKKGIEQKDLEDDNVVVTGGGNVVGRDVVRVSGDIVNINNIFSATPPVDLDQLRVDYLAFIRSSYRTLAFKGIPLPQKLPPEVPLESLYVPLLARPELPTGETWARVAEHGLKQQEIFRESVQVEQAIMERDRVVVLGDPGSGKTTLLKWLALKLADQSNAPLPIIIPLNAYAESLSRADRNLQQYFSDYFAGIAQGLSNLTPLFDSALTQGQAVVLLDGLDASQSHSRAHLVSKIEAFASEAVAQGNRVVVTSRIVGYRESPLDAHDWSLYTLVDFDQPAIEQFLSRWFLVFGSNVTGNIAEKRQSAEYQSQNLIKVINANPSLAGLASNPFLLAVLVLLISDNVSLPLRRVELYELYLRILINTWNRARTLDSRAVGHSPDYLQTISILGRLALWLKEERPSGIVPEELLLEWLTDYYAGAEWQKPRGEAMQVASEFLDSTRKYSNILIERGQDHWGFVHLALEEHLAARGLAQLRTSESIATIQKHLQDPAWREVILLAMGIWGVVRRQTNIAGEVALALLQMGNQGILLASAGLEDLGEAGLGQAVAREIQVALKAIH